MNLLEIQKLRVKFKDFTPVKGVSLAIKQGELVALVGGSGSGKSTLAMSILRLQDYATLRGEIWFEKRNLADMGEDELIKIRGRKIAMIFQEPMTSLNPLHTAGDQIYESLALHTDHPTKERVYELLKQVELGDAGRIYDSYPHELSGGQRQRVMIAMALAGNPDLLIADEPTTALDVSVQAQILALLKKLQKQLGLAILFITHDLDVVRQIADRVYVMKFGKIISTRTPDDMAPLPRKKMNDAGIDPVICVRNLSVFYQDFKAVKNVSFDLCAGQTLGIVGESGSGKSSLGQGLMRLIGADGKVIVRGQDFFALKGQKLREARGHIQMVLQDPTSSLNPRMMIADIVGEGLKIRRGFLLTRLLKHKQSKAADSISDEQIRARVQKVLKDVGLAPDIMGRYPHELSGGQRTRVALARALILNPAVLVLDEVTSSLDIYTQRQLMELLIQLQAEYKLAYIFISHDMKTIKMMSDKIMVMKNGHAVEYADTDQIFSNPKEEYTKELIRVSFLSQS